ncbi:MAG TPA: CPBP family intramembrane glutamic endopeptidase [Thermoanaerobaculia bacterium]|nr:CPBP family intramembrane glutamic endopeptidase [Thermoanaerobaculia bacterium]
MIGVAGFSHLLFFGIIVPAGAIRSKKLLEHILDMPRQRFFRGVMLQVAALTLISLIVARFEHVTVFPHRLPPVNAVVAGVVVLAIAIAFGWTQWTKAVKERKPVIVLFMPLDARERLWWVAAAALAGFGEELTWRGVQTVLLTRLFHNYFAAVAVCVVMFAIAHAIQGWESTAIIAVFAAAFHVIVWMSGSLYVAMIVHFIYDLIAGFSYAHLARKLGYFEGRTFAADPARSATQTI